MSWDQVDKEKINQVKSPFDAEEVQDSPRGLRLKERMKKDGKWGMTLEELIEAAGPFAPKVSKLTNAMADRGEAALSTQVGGGHYKSMAIQPVEFNQLNELNYCEANVVKYICRHKTKNGLEDLKKAKHYIDLLMELEYGEDA